MFDDTFSKLFKAYSTFFPLNMDCTHSRSEYISIYQSSTMKNNLHVSMLNSNSQSIDPWVLPIRFIALSYIYQMFLFFWLRGFFYQQIHMSSISQSISYVQDSRKFLKGPLTKCKTHALGLPLFFKRNCQVVLSTVTLPETAFLFSYYYIKKN